MNYGSRLAICSKDTHVMQQQVGIGEDPLPGKL